MSVYESLQPVPILPYMAKEKEGTDFNKVGVSLDHPGGTNVIIRVLKRGGGRQKDRPVGGDMRRTRPVLVGCEDGGRGP